MREALFDWSAAWSAQDVRAYLNAYSADFVPKKNRSRSAWEKQRRDRVSAPKAITVSLNDIAIKLNGPDRATVRFEQHYKSNTYEDHERKTLVFVHEDGGWRIKQES